MICNVTLESVKTDHDWQETFGYAARKLTGVPGYQGPMDGIETAQVIAVLAADNGENDGPDWVGVFILNGPQGMRFLFASAGCDYTGWDCQASGYGVVSWNMADLVRWGIGQEDRLRLGIPAPEGE